MNTWDRVARADKADPTGEEKTLPIRGSKRGIIGGKSFEGVIRLKPYGVELVEQAGWL